MTQDSTRDLCGIKSFIATHFPDEIIPSRRESTDGGSGGHELDGNPGVVGGHEVGVLSSGWMNRTRSLIKVTVGVLKVNL